MVTLKCLIPRTTPWKTSCRYIAQLTTPQTIIDKTCAGRTQRGSRAGNFQPENGTPNPSRKTIRSTIIKTLENRLTNLFARYYGEQTRVPRFRAKNERNRKLEKKGRKEKMGKEEKRRREKRSFLAYDKVSLLR